MSTNFHLMSDLHLEFGMMPLPDHKLDLSNVTLLAVGDIGQVRNKEHVDYMMQLASRYRHVVHVPGNHCYYGCRVDKVDRMWTEIAADVPNYHYLNPGHLVVDDVLILGAALWTDLKRGDPLVTMHAGTTMNDYRQVTFKAPGEVYRKLRPTDTVRLNLEHRRFLKEYLEAFGEDGAVTSATKVLVATHHAPFADCIHESYRRDHLTNYAYHNTELDMWTEDYQIDVWVHGHTHHQYQMYKNRTLVMCHPRGYVGYEKSATNYTPKEFTL